MINKYRSSNYRYGRSRALPYLSEGIGSEIGFPFYHISSDLRTGNILCRMNMRRSRKWRPAELYQFDAVGVTAEAKQLHRFSKYGYLPYLVQNVTSRDERFGRFINHFMRDGNRHAVLREFNRAVRYLRVHYRVRTLPLMEHILETKEQSVVCRNVRVGRKKQIIVPHLIIDSSHRLLKPIKYLYHLLLHLKDRIRTTQTEQSADDKHDTKKHRRLRVVRRSYEYFLRRRARRNRRYMSFRDVKKHVFSSILSDQTSRRRKRIHVTKRSKHHVRMLRKFHVHMAHVFLFLTRKRNRKIIDDMVDDSQESAYKNRRNIPRRTLTRLFRRRMEKMPRIERARNWSMRFKHRSTLSRRRAYKTVPLRLYGRLIK